MSRSRSSRMRARGAAAALALLLPAAAAGAAPSGEEIAREADRRQRTLSQFYEGRLSVIDAKGKVKEKAWRFWRLGYGGDSKSVTQFTDPPEVAGVGLLTYARRGREDEQWMWTPAIRRERRIAAQEKSSRFLGTDFTYEDLQERIVEDWDHRLRGEEPCEGGTCWVVEAVPHPGKKSQYARTLVRYRQSDYAVTKIEMFVGDALRRVLTATGHRSVQGIVTAHRLVMADVVKGSRTELSLGEVRSDLAFEDAFFTLRSLQEVHAPPKPTGP